MEKYEVLARFFDVSEKIRNDREKKRAAKAGINELKSKYRLPPSACTMLRTLLENGSLNQRAIAKLTNVSSQAISEGIKKLEMYELIIKENGTHNNEKIISLTETGKIFANELDTGIKEHASLIFKDFTEEECETFYNLLNKILE